MNKSVTKTNLGASIRARLLNYSKNNKLDHNAVLLQYFQERFLYRLSISRYRNHFILKGALLVITYKIPRTRPTKDIDFLGVDTPNDNAKIKSIITEILTQSCNDGVEFDEKSLVLENIAEENTYHGIRAKFFAGMDTIRKRIQIDIGFGDIITPTAMTRSFPTLLDMPVPEIMVYPLETVIAEKYHTIVKFSFPNSRMKDFYDIYFLLKHTSIHNKIIKNAIENTFANRNTSLDDRKVIYTDEFRLSPERQNQWRAFLNRYNLEKIPEFPYIIEFFKQFFESILNWENK
ncbi:nucleotidyl transferase AbiEii/AbiGii toxin family protein [candidate division KSB1 bacterium]|nr:nucleotidyl transferase AbiEii/AbiGii toxin family protein [candidate division KSB1 bacterium]